MSTLEDWQEAEQILRETPEYHWLTESQQGWWTVSEVAERLNVGNKAVLGWCPDIKGATLFSQQVGWRLPRSGLMIYFARHIKGADVNVHQSTNTRLMKLEKIARIVAEKNIAYDRGQAYCFFCQIVARGGEVTHKPDCPVIEAQQLTAEPDII